jgi:hypothetical protein
MVEVEMAMEAADLQVVTTVLEERRVAEKKAKADTDLASARILEVTPQRSSLSKRRLGQALIHPIIHRRTLRGIILDRGEMTDHWVMILPDHGAIIRGVVMIIQATLGTLMVGMVMGRAIIRAIIRVIMILGLMLGPTSVRPSVQTPAILMRRRLQQLRHRLQSLHLDRTKIRKRLLLLLGALIEPLESHAQGRKPFAWH